MNLDFTNVATRDPLEPGFYTGRIIEAEEKTASTGSPMIAVVYQITGDSNGEPVEGIRKVWDNLVLTEASMWRVKQAFEAYGFDVEGSLDITPADLIGIDLGLKLGHNIYQGETRNNILGYKTLDEMAGLN